jgi:hypothetical protein
MMIEVSQDPFSPDRYAYLGLWGTPRGMPAPRVDMYWGSWFKFEPSATANAFATLSSDSLYSP